MEPVDDAEGRCNERSSTRCDRRHRARVVTPMAARPTEPIRTAGRRPLGNRRAYGSSAQRRGGGLAADDGTISPGGPRRVQRRGHAPPPRAGPLRLPVVRRPRARRRHRRGVLRSGVAPLATRAGRGPPALPDADRGQRGVRPPSETQARARHDPAATAGGGVVRGSRRRSRRALVCARPPPDRSSASCSCSASSRTCPRRRPPPCSTSHGAP